jgi:hypothetical protein
MGKKGAQVTDIAQRSNGTQLRKGRFRKEPRRMNDIDENIWKLTLLGYRFMIKNGNYVVKYTAPTRKIPDKYNFMFFMNPPKLEVIAEGSVADFNAGKARKEALNVAIAAAWAHHIRTRGT